MTCLFTDSFSVKPFFVTFTMSISEFRGNLSLWLNKEERVMTCIEFYSLQYLLEWILMR